LTSCWWCARSTSAQARARLSRVTSAAGGDPLSAPWHLGGSSDSRGAFADLGDGPRVMTVFAKSHAIAEYVTAGERVPVLACTAPGARADAQAVARAELLAVPEDVSGVSSCCSAPLTVEGRTTQFYACTGCGQACDAVAAETETGAVPNVSTCA
jgi:hypothetical protein